MIPWVCRLNPASSMKTQFLQQSKPGVGLPFLTFSFRKATIRSEFLAAVNFSSFFSVALQFCTPCRYSAEIDIISPRKLRAQMMHDIGEYSSWMLINVFHEKSRMLYSQLTFTSRCWLVASDRQSFLVVIVVFLNISRSRSEGDINYHCCVFGSLTFLNY